MPVCVNEPSTERAVSTLYFTFSGRIDQVTDHDFLHRQLRMILLKAYRIVRIEEGMSSIQTVLVLHITSDHQATSGIIRYPPAPALHNTPMAPPSPHASFWNTRTPHQYELTETRTCRIASYTARCDATSRKAERTKVRPRPYLEHQNLRKPLLARRVPWELNRCPPLEVP